MRPSTARLHLEMSVRSGCPAGIRATTGKLVPAPERMLAYPRETLLLIERITTPAVGLASSGPSERIFGVKSIRSSDFEKKKGISSLSRVTELPFLTSFLCRLATDQSRGTSTKQVSFAWSGVSVLSIETYQRELGTKCRSGHLPCSASCRGR